MTYKISPDPSFPKRGTHTKLRRANNPNLEILSGAVKKLGPLADEMVFLGGCATPLSLIELIEGRFFIVDKRWRKPGPAFFFGFPITSGMTG